MISEMFLALSCVVLLSGCSSSGSGAAAGGGSAGTASGGASSGGGGGLGGSSGSGGLGGSSGSSSSGGSAGTSTGGASAGPQVEIDTSMGKMVIELDPTNMPTTTANFLAYVDAGFYTGTIFHRVIPDFVIQGGGFTSGLTPATPNAPIALETSPQVLHDYGVISMARTSAPNSATSQFFLVNAKAGSHSLDGQYAAFGRMLEGQAVLDAISEVPTQTSGSFDDVPVTEVVINGMQRK
jgi:peptidyl-prolyl cis-trans isomerase A (cyclophilin A)